MSSSETNASGRLRQFTAVFEIITVTLDYCNARSCTTRSYVSHVLPPTHTILTTSRHKPMTYRVVKDQGPRTRTRTKDQGQGQGLVNWSLRDFPGGQQRRATANIGLLTDKFKN